MTLYFNPNGTVKADLFKVPLSALTEESTFQLTAVKLNRLADNDGKITDMVKDITYTVFVPDFMCQINVKVDSTTPVVSPEKLDSTMAAGSDVFVELPTKETFIKPYAMSYGAFNVSIRAPYIKVVE